MLPHVKSKLVECIDALEIWIDENQEHEELAGTEFLEKAKESLKNAQDFIEKLDEGHAAVIAENGAMEEEAIPVAIQNDDMLSAHSSSEEN